MNAVLLQPIFFIVIRLSYVIHGHYNYNTWSLMKKFRIVQAKF